jgi:sodium-dependent phosphate transporter
LTGSALWNLFATLLRLPVSGTHSILGSLLGFTLVAKQFVGIKWRSIGAVVASWFISPAAAGSISIVGYILLYKFVLSVKQSKRKVLVLSILPGFFGVTVFVNAFSILYKGPSFLVPFKPPLEEDGKLSKGFYLPEFLFSFGVSLILSAIVWLVVLMIWVPKQRKIIEEFDQGQSFPGKSHTFINFSCCVSGMLLTLHSLSFT